MAPPAPVARSAAGLRGDEAPRPSSSDASLVAVAAEGPSLLRRSHSSLGDWPRSASPPEAAPVAAPAAAEQKSSGGSQRRRAEPKKKHPHWSAGPVRLELQSRARENHALRMWWPSPAVAPFRDGLAVAMSKSAPLLHDAPIRRGSAPLLALQAAPLHAAQDTQDDTPDESKDARRRREESSVAVCDAAAPEHADVGPPSPAKSTDTPPLEGSWPLPALVKKPRKQGPSRRPLQQRPD